MTRVQFSVQNNLGSSMTYHGRASPALIDWLMGQAKEISQQVPAPKEDSPRIKRRKAIAACAKNESKAKAARRFQISRERVRQIVKEESERTG